MTIAKLFFNSENCRGATSGATGRHYNADSQGFVNVSDTADIKCLKEGGYIEAGMMPVTSKWWECENCNFSAVINHCPKCGSESLTKIEK